MAVSGLGRFLALVACLFPTGFKALEWHLLKGFVLPYSASAFGCLGSSLCSSLLAAFLASADLGDSSCFSHLECLACLRPFVFVFVSLRVCVSHGMVCCIANVYVLLVPFVVTRGTGSDNEDFTALHGGTPFSEFSPLCCYSGCRMGPYMHS